MNLFGVSVCGTKNHPFRGRRFLAAWCCCACSPGVWRPPVSRKAPFQSDLPLPEVGIQGEKFGWSTAAFFRAILNGGEQKLGVLFLVGLSILG